MHLIAPHGRSRKWDIRFRNHDGKTVRIPGQRDEASTRRLGDRVGMLIAAKVNGDSPPAALQTWIDNMPASLASRLVALGLLDQRRVDRLRTLKEHVEDFERTVKSRKTNTAGHAKRQAAMVRRLTAALKVTALSQVTEDAVAQTLATITSTAATRRHYVIAFKDFCKWMVRSGRAAKNPVADLRPPGQYEAPTIERVPLTVQQFQSLMKSLDGFSRYPHQIARWTAYDRKIIYWVAVQTALRLNELRSLRVRSLHLDAKPPQIVIRAADAKNRVRGSVPIPSNVAAALRAYVLGRDDDEKLFPFPSAHSGVLDMFRRDLDGAKIKWDFGNDNPDTIDFHTLRSTAITWWLDVNELPPKRVQILARLKTLALVAAYSRNLRLDEFAWLDNGPTLVEVQQQQAS